MEQNDKIDQLATMIKGEFDSLRDEIKTVDKKVDDLTCDMKNEFMSVRRGIDFLADRIHNHEVRIATLEGTEK